MLGKLTSALSSLNTSRDPTPPPPPTHDSPLRAKQYAELADKLHHAGVPVSVADCAACDHPCPPGGHQEGAGQVVEVGRPWSGKSYPEYVQDTYGSMSDWPDSIETDWDSELAGSSQGGRGRIAVVSTGKSDWDRDHYDDKSLLSHHLHEHLSRQSSPKSASDDGKLAYVATRSDTIPPSIYSSSLISQSTDPTDQSLLVFPDWKVVHELENSRAGAEEIWDGLLGPGIGRSGKKSRRVETVGRRMSWTLPYRAIILLCSHKRRDKRCHIAAPLLRSALHAVLEKHDITVDETGSSLACLDGDALEMIDGTDAERDDEAEMRIRDIEGISGGEGGEVGIFNINHLGGHRYAGVMLLLFPSGAYVSYGRVTPLEIPRIVEETILQGKVVPGLLRNVVLNGKDQAGDSRKGAGILSW